MLVIWKLFQNDLLKYIDIYFFTHYRQFNVKLLITELINAMLLVLLHTRPRRDKHLSFVGQSYINYYLNSPLHRMLF